MTRTRKAILAARLRLAGAAFLMTTALRLPVWAQPILLGQPAPPSVPPAPLPPPTAPVQPPAPMVTYAWMAGHWAQHGSGYEWAPPDTVGRLVVGRIWVPEGWVWRDGQYVWAPAHWGN